MYHEIVIDNLLVSQKNAIIEAIDNGYYIRAAIMLDTVKEMWLTLDYSYKFKELEERLKIARTQERLDSKS